MSLQEWPIPCVAWDIEDGLVFLQAPQAASEVEIKQHKQPNFCAIASCLPSIRAPESEQYFAVPGQEILGLLGCKGICIEYFQKLFIKGKRNTNPKHENATVDISCVPQKAFLCLKTHNGRVSQTDRFTTFCTKRNPFLCHSGVPCKMPTFRCRSGSYLVWIEA